MPQHDSLSLCGGYLIVLLIRRDGTQSGFGRPQQYNTTIMNVEHDFSFSDIGLEGVSLFDLVDLALAMNSDTVPSGTLDFDMFTGEGRSGRFIACLDMNPGDEAICRELIFT